MADALDDEWWLEENTTDSREKETKRKKKQRKEVIAEWTTTSKRETRDGKRKRKKLKIESITTEFHGRDVREELWKSFCDCSSKSLSSLELEELQIDDSCCLFDDLLHTGSLTELPQYLHEVVPNWKKHVNKLDKKAANGAPVLLFVSAAASRAVKLNRSAAEFKGKCKTAKLFAKHMKIEEQELFLESHVVHFGIGTPSRVLSLLQHGSLKTSQVKYVILDWTWRDQKLRRMIDIPEVREALISLLKGYVFPLAGAGKLKIGLF